MIQKEIVLGDIHIPLVVVEGNKYYPVSYISTRLLLRNSSLLTREAKVELNEQIKQLTVDYGETTGGFQNTYCIDENGLIELVKRVKLGRMSSEQRSNFNYLREYLGLKKVSEDKRIIHTYDYSHYNEFIQNAIKEVLEEDENIDWQLCSKCNRYYPFHKNFYKVNTSTNGNLYTYCNECNDSGNRFTIKDSTLKLEYYKHGLEAYMNRRDHDVIKIYENYLCSDKVKFPDVIRNKEDYLRIVKYLIDTGKVDKFKINQKELLMKYKLKAINNICSMDEIYKYIHGDDYYLTPWKFKTSIFSFKQLTMELANNIFVNYINNNDVDIKNPLEVDYGRHTKKSKINNLTDGNTLYFAVQFNNFEYPGYMYKQTSMNYYKNETNLLFDLKYLIEKDMKLDINKIPLYLTRFNLQKKCSPLYRYIISNKNGSVYYWVNKLYPDKFVEADFDVNPYRSEFDSDKEMYIHEILTERFNNVIYNQRNRETTITIDGMVPDWFVFTDRGVWIIEYFGLYDKRYYLNSRVDAYIKKTKVKMEKHKKLIGYHSLFLFPSDIDNDFKGVHDKLNIIDQNLDTKAI